MFQLQNIHHLLGCEPWIRSSRRELQHKDKKLLERFNLSYFHCSNKQSSWCQMKKKKLLNKSHQSLRLISMMIWELTWTTAAETLVKTSNKDVWRGGRNQQEQEIVDVHAVLNQLHWCEVKQSKDGNIHLFKHTHTHTQMLSRAFHQSSSSTAGRCVQRADWSLESSDSRLKIILTFLHVSTFLYILYIYTGDI